MVGYWNRPERPRPPFADGWLCTGDVAKADDRGFLYIVDRKKDMIISGGFNVYPKESRPPLFGHPSEGRRCHRVPDDKWGESVKAVVKFSIRREGGREGLIATPRPQGPVLTPKTVDFVDASRSPRWASTTAALRAAHWGGRDRGVN